MSLLPSLPSSLSPIPFIRTFTSHVLSLRTHLQTLNTETRLHLRRNTRTLRLLSDALRTVALLSPSADAELRAEAAATIAALLCVYRDLPPSNPSLPSLPVAALALIQATQLLSEMLVAKYLGRAAQLSAVTGLEAAKVALRLSLLANRASQGRILAAADQELPEAPAPPECTCGLANVPGSNLVALESGRRSGRKILKPKSKRPKSAAYADAQIEGVGPVPNTLRQAQVDPDPMLDALFLIAYERRANWVVRMFVPDVTCEACAAKKVQNSSNGLGETVEGIRTAYSALKPGELAAEVAYVARPLVHLLLIRRFGWRSWKAWTTALILDLGSRLAMAPPSDHSDVDERRRRMAQLVLYLGRSPLFDLIMRGFIRKLTSPLRCIPLVGGATSSAIEWLTLLQQYWFYTSAS